MIGEAPAADEDQGAELGTGGVESGGVSGGAGAYDDDLADVRVRAHA